MDPIATPLLIYVCGNLGKELISDACKSYLTDRLKGVFSKAAKLGSKDDLQIAYEAAMQQAYEKLCETLLRNMETFGTKRSELAVYRNSLEAFIKNQEVVAELFRSIENPNDETAPSPQILQQRWDAIGGHRLPSDQLWLVTTLAYRNQALQESFLSEPLREILLGKNVNQLLKEFQRQGGVQTPLRLDQYRKRMLAKYSPVDLANLMPSYADAPGVFIREVFVSQNVRENPPPIDIPKDLAEHLKKAGRDKADEHAYDELDEEQLEKFRTAYVSQSPRPVLDVVAAPGNRLTVLTGEPGSGKSTLMRYLLTGIIEPPLDPKSGKPLPWTQAFKEAFPLLIELREFYALRCEGKCVNFLEYVHGMGRNQHWFLDQHTVNASLEIGLSLVMFDGLDEIFDSADRERVMHEIGGFAQRYPKARIIVTSRPVGYKEQILRGAGFKHFGIQDLDNDQIETFVKGWFALTFPQDPGRVAQRIERVTGSVKHSKSIRLLAGNPMLLTIMALLAREEELPRERAKFYEKAVDVLCHHWDANRNLGLPEDRYLNADDKNALLRRVAMRMQAAKEGLKGNFIAEDNLEQEIQAYLIDEQWQTDRAEAKKAARRMIRQLRERNYILCLRAPHLYGFVHRTFLEYLTATEYVRRFDRQPQQMTIEDLINLFDEHCRDEEWREVLRLICGQIDEQFVGQIVERLATRTDWNKWDGRTPLLELPLAIWCLTEVRTTTRLEAAGAQLLTTVIDAAQRGSGFGGLSQSFDNDLTQACEELGQGWPGRGVLGESESSILKDAAECSYGDSFWPRLIACVFDNRKVVMDLSQSEAGFYDGVFVRLDALNTLLEKWPDEATRKLFEERAVKDPEEYVRRSTLGTLAWKWPDDRTRDLLEERTVQDEHLYVCNAAFEILAEKWPDDRTWKFLAERAPIDGAAASLLGERHSEFGQIVFLEDRDVPYFYLNPTKAIPRDHIERAAEKADVPPEEIEETVRSLSEHMGWDITKGSGA